MNITVVLLLFVFVGNNDITQKHTFGYLSTSKWLKSHIQTTVRTRSDTVHSYPHSHGYSNVMEHEGDVDVHTLITFICRILL
jgi:hypothetical protein